MRRLKPSHLTMMIIGTFGVIAILGIFLLRETAAKVRLDNQNLAEEICRIEQENLYMQDRINALGTDAAVEQLARERLHWVYDREILYVEIGE